MRLTGEQVQQLYQLCLADGAPISKSKLRVPESLPQTHRNHPLSAWVGGTIASVNGKKGEGVAVFEALRLQAEDCVIRSRISNGGFP